MNFKQIMVWIFQRLLQEELASNGCCAESDSEGASGFGPSNVSLSQCKL